MKDQFSYFKNSSSFLKYVVKKIKQLEVLADFIVVGKGRDLTISEGILRRYNKEGFEAWTEGKYHEFSWRKRL